ncbi:MAG: hypothetical protein P8Y69_06085, partial [Gammaproteobacteria bacterium]
MTPTTVQFANDSESLQADVMRFMAIIAFCLIAILALVRNVEPADVTEKNPEPTVKPAPISAPEPEPQETPAPKPVEIAVTEPVPQTDPVTNREPLPTFPEAEPKWSEPEPAVEAEPDEPVADPLPQEAVEPDTTEPVDAGATEEGLILRFASDRDFLRLIARGDITVYAYQE